jgi:hypothetical protein
MWHYYLETTKFEENNYESNFWRALNLNYTPWCIGSNEASMQDEFTRLKF